MTVLPYEFTTFSKQILKFQWPHWSLPSSFSEKKNLIFCVNLEFVPPSDNETGSDEEVVGHRGSPAHHDVLQDVSESHRSNTVNNADSPASTESYTDAGAPITPHMSSASPPETPGYVFPPETPRCIFFRKCHILVHVLIFTLRENLVIKV